MSDKLITTLPEGTQVYFAREGEWDCGDDDEGTESPNQEGWFWQSDSDAMGPFDSEGEAIKDAWRQHHIEREPD